MKIFITGVNGYIGGAIAQKMSAQGHEVRGMIRKKEHLKTVEKYGITPILGSLEDLKVLERVVKWADIVIHAADYEDLYSASFFLSALRDTGKTYLHLSGSSIAGVVTMGAADAVVYTETTIQSRLEKAALSAIHSACKQAKYNGTRAIVIAPAIVYSEDLLESSPFFSAWAQWALCLGAVPYLGEGQNRWSTVYRQDLADLFALAIQAAPAGSVFFAENGAHTLKEMAALLSYKLELEHPPISLPVEAFISKWGLATTCTVFGGNSLVSAARAKELGWRPQGKSLVQVLAP